MSRSGRFLNPVRRAAQGRPHALRKQCVSAVWASAASWTTIRCMTVAALADHFVVLLPYLRLKRTYQIVGVEFVPLRDPNGQVPSVLQSGVGQITKILSSYVDREGVPLVDCVVATIPGRGWDLVPDDFDQVRWAASLLFLTSWSCNEYLPRFLGNYVNSTQFRVVGQRYQGDMPDYLAFTARRRDGGITDGGYEHGELKFGLPPQLLLGSPAIVDEPFLSALDAAVTAKLPLVDRLRTALPFVEVANSDDDFLTRPTETILMGSAFEQLLRGDASAYILSQKLGKQFLPFGTVTVKTARTNRPEIRIDAAPTDTLVWRLWKACRRRLPETAAATRFERWLVTKHELAQLNWWVHRIWINELYDVRSKVVHKGTAATRAWGWTVFEHLVMAAHVFPLVVKLLLSADNRYALTTNDRIRCFIVDKVLASPQWADDRAGKSEQSWSSILSETHSNVTFEEALRDIRRSHPELFGDAPTGTVS